MPIPDYPHRAMEDCKAAGFDYESKSKEVDSLKKLNSEQNRVIVKLRDTLAKCVFAYENEASGGARQLMVFRWAKIVLEEEFGNGNG